MKKYERFTGVNAVRVVQVVEVTSIIGDGTEGGKPVQEVVEYYDFEGKLLARKNPYHELKRGDFVDNRDEYREIKL